MQVKTRLFNNKIAIWHFIAVLTMCVWGTTFISTKVLLQYGLSPADIFLLRFLQAYVGILFVSHSRLWCGRLQDELLMLTLGVCGGSLYFFTENTALRYTLAGNVSLEVCTAPLITALLASLIRKERLGWRLWCGSVIALAGVSLIVVQSNVTFHFNIVGDLLAISAAILWSVYQLLTNPMTEKYGILFTTRKVFGYGILTILLYMFFAGSSVPQWADLCSSIVIGNLLYLGIIASLVCFMTWNKVMRRIGSVNSANYIYLNPVVTVCFSSIILHEPITLSTIMGGAAIIGGVYLTQYSQKSSLRIKKNK